MEKTIKSYKDISKLYLGDCLDVMPQIETDSIDAVITDPPYGIKFINKKWDAAIPSIDIWKECLRVLKPGAFAFVMSSPRQDVLSHMICNISDAGFDTNFSSIYWTYASGFPKTQNLSKVADKRAGVEREIIGEYKHHPEKPQYWKDHKNASSTLYEMDMPKDSNSRYITKSATPQAKALDGAYSGFQPKPAVEVVIVAMKPLSEKTYLDQAIANKHGCTWLNDCRIPFSSDRDIPEIDRNGFKVGEKNNYISNDYGKYQGGTTYNPDIKGRFPANVLCEDDVLNDGNIRKSGNGIKNSIRNEYSSNTFQINRSYSVPSNGGDAGSFSRYFSLDAWFAERIKLLPKEAQKTFPFMIVPKASKTEKYQNLDITPEPSNRPSGIAYNEHSGIHLEREGNIHPTIKPLKLMMWLIVLGTQEGDTVLDPFMGSGTTPMAAKATHRIYKGIELEREFYDIAIKRIDEVQQTIDHFL